MKKLWITSECTCDLSRQFLAMNKVEVMYMYIKTDKGCFRDLEEMTAVNVVEYFANDGQEIFTYGASPEEYEAFFEKMLEQYEEIIHISFSSKIGISNRNARKGAEKFQGRVHIFDTQSLSTGMAHCVIKALDLVKQGKEAQEILAELEQLREKISVSFIAENVDTLYRAKRVSKTVKVLCSAFLIHPVLAIVNGELKLQGVEIGNFEKSVLRYVRKQLRKPSTIQKERAFVTYSTCSLRLRNKVNRQINKKCPFREIMETAASATVTSNCGANTLGVIFVRE